MKSRGEITMIGNKIIRFETIKSSNDYLKKNASTFEDGTIVISKNQTAGKGRSNHVWMSEEGNLYFSFLINRTKSRSKIFELLMCVSNAVVELLKDYNIEASIKYPNDILVDKKKICGILIESVGSKEIEYIVVGVGINVNQIDFKELKDKAISMVLIKGTEFDINEILNKFIMYYNSFKKIPFEKVFKNYLKSSLIIGKNIVNNNIIYIVKGISNDGKLIVENNNKIEYLNFDEIRIKEL